MYLIFFIICSSLPYCREIIFDYIVLVSEVQISHLLRLATHPLAALPTKQTTKMCMLLKAMVIELRIYLESWTSIFF